MIPILGGKASSLCLEISPQSVERGVLFLVLMSRSVPCLSGCTGLGRV